MFHRILVPLDGSALAERAVLIAAQIAQTRACPLVLLQIISPPLDYGGGISHIPLLTQQLVDREMAEAHTYLGRLAQSAPLRGIDVQPQVLFGMPVACILDVVESQDVDLIVLSSHGRSGLKRWVLGSVARRVAHHSTVPVLLLRSENPALPAVEHKDTRPPGVIVALDGSSLAEAALAPAAQLVSAFATPLPGAAKPVLHILHVMEPPLATSQDRAGVSPLYNTMLHEQAQEYLAGVCERVVAQAGNPHLTVTWSIIYSSDVADAIITAAEERRTQHRDVLAMATHGRGGLQRWVMGSITERVLEGTKLPMLVVRPAQVEGKPASDGAEPSQHALPGD
jgi:nucleotide-binding universal stress UspA family protein